MLILKGRRIYSGGRTFRAAAVTNGQNGTASAGVVYLKPKTPKEKQLARREKKAAREDRKTGHT
jgi:hypothetical protein